MKSVLTLFMLAVFAMFISVDNAETILSLDAETFLPQLEEETVSLAPNAVVLEVRAVTVSNVLKWPNEDDFSPVALDVQTPRDAELSTAEERSGGAGILPGGRSRLR